MLLFADEPTPKKFETICPCKNRRFSFSCDVIKSKKTKQYSVEVRCPFRKADCHHGDGLLTTYLDDGWKPRRETIYLADPAEDND